MTSQQSAPPVIVITMGDPAGVGPEVIARAIADPEISGICRPLVIGDPGAMERAVEVTGQTIRLVLTEGLPTKDTDGTILLRPLSNLAPTDMEYGGPSSEAGDAMFRELYESLVYGVEGQRPDVFYVLADFDAYAEAQAKLAHAYTDKRKWAKMALLNVARSGKFSADRTIEDYVRDIWKLKKVVVK